MCENNENRPHRDGSDGSSSDSEMEGREESFESLQAQVVKLRRQRDEKRRLAAETAEKLRKIFVDVTTPVQVQQEAAAAAAGDSESSGASRVTFAKSKAQEDLEWARQQPQFAQEMEALKQKYPMLDQTDLEIFSFVNTMNILRPSEQKPGEVAASSGGEAGSSSSSSSNRPMRL